MLKKTACARTEVFADARLPVGFPDEVPKLIRVRLSLRVSPSLNIGVLQFKFANLNLNEDSAEPQRPRDTGTRAQKSVRGLGEGT